MKRFLALAFLSVVGMPASAAVIPVELPAHVEWCKTVVVADVQSLQTPVSQQSVFHEGQEPIALCARDRGLTHIGVPFVQSATVGEANPKEVRLTFCAVVVAGGASPCDSTITSRDVAPAKALAAVCAREAAAQCKSELTAALRAEPFSLDDAAVAHIQWRFAQAKSSSNTPAAIIDALNNAEGQVVNGKTAAVTSEAVAQFVVVAAPLPSVPAHPQPQAQAPGGQQ